MHSTFRMLALLKKGRMTGIDIDYMKGVIQPCQGQFTVIQE
jgi:hypothetical protein